MSESQIFINRPHLLDKAYEKAIRWHSSTSLTAQ